MNSTTTTTTVPTIAPITNLPKKKISKPFQRRFTTSGAPRRSLSDERKKDVDELTGTGAEAAAATKHDADVAGSDSAYSVLVDTVAGIFGGVAGKAVEYPADTIKVKLQAQTTTGTSFTGPLDCFKQTVQQGGVRALYAGLPVPLLGSMLEMGVLFTAMGRIKRIASEDPENPTLVETCVSGGGAGVFASFVLTPVELIKCRLQTRLYAGGAMDCIRTSIKEEGVFVFCTSFYFFFQLLLLLYENIITFNMYM
jgi:hypothetical protein